MKANLQLSTIGLNKSKNSDNESKNADIFIYYFLRLFVMQFS